MHSSHEHPSVIRLAELLSQAESLADEAEVLRDVEAQAIQAVVERILSLLPFVDLATQEDVAHPVRWETAREVPLAVQQASSSFSRMRAKLRTGSWLRDPEVRVAIDTTHEHVLRVDTYTRGVIKERLRAAAIAVSEGGRVYLQLGFSEDSWVTLEPWRPAHGVTTAVVLESLERFAAALAPLPDRVAAVQAERRARLLPGPTRTGR